MSGAAPRRRHAPPEHPAGAPYHDGVLEAVFTGLLVLASVAIGWSALVVLYKLFAGQR